LNRFSQNWTYVNVQQLSSREYFVFATVAFSTVLPSIDLTRRIIEEILKLRPPHKIRVVQPFLVYCLGIASAMSLVLLPSFPDFLFATIWLSPLMLLAMYACLFGEPKAMCVFRLPQALYWSLSGLFCGGLWELWNWKSFARWVYHVPYVD